MYCAMKGRASISMLSKVRFVVVEFVWWEEEEVRTARRGDGGRWRVAAAWVRVEAGMGR